MWDRLKKILGYAWASPVTFFGLAYTAAFWGLRWHKWHGVEGDALVWYVDDDKAPKWLNDLWKKWGGHAIGNVVVLKDLPKQGSNLLVHEQRHVLQYMLLGPFQPIVYGISMLAIKISCPSSDPYYDCPFEIDARRAAGETIDVVGKLKQGKQA